ncbi:HET domain-containing protein [Microdochium nivale]|nr:HET domain-containing protein [Microdochium nivale]
MDRSRCVRAMSLGLAKSTPALTSPDSIAEYDPMPRRSRTPQYDVCASEPGLDELQSTDIVRDISLAVGESQIILQDNLCKPCAAWFEKHGPASYPGARPPVATHSRWRSHHTSFFELIKCCQTRASPKSAGPCVLCELFWCGIRSRLCQRRESRRRRPRLEESDLGSAMLEFDLRGETMASLITRSGGWLLTLTVFKAWDLQMGVMMESRREVPRNMCKAPANLRISGSSLSSQTFAQIRDWMSLCGEEHLGYCDSMFMHTCADETPTRLILVEAALGRFRLVDRDDFLTGAVDFPRDSTTPLLAQWEKYLALSYRWGAEKTDVQLILSTKTDSQLRAGLPLELLPPTLQDACTVVHMLGHRWLWVDRLCIRQDSSQDWNHEAARMGKVYQNAILTISASCAANEDSGFFRTRRAELIQPVVVRHASAAALGGYAEENDNEPHCMISSAAAKDRHELRPGCKLGYLADRGWVFQERILSSRIVHFSEDQVHWECSQLEAHETWPYSTLQYDKAHTRVSLVRPGEQDRGDRRKHMPWQELIEYFSATTLTYAADALPAISGIAQRFQRLMRSSSEYDPYCAGLWRSTFMLDLCWSEHRVREQIREYIAPSWSWASAQTAVHWYRISKGSAYVLLADVQDYRLLHSGDDVFGRVHDGWALLRGHLSAVVIGLPKRGIETQWNSTPNFSIISTTSGGFNFRFSEDNYGHAENALAAEAADSYLDEQLFCVPVCEVNVGTTLHVQFLLLAVHGTIRYSSGDRARPRLAVPATYTGDEFERVGWSVLKLAPESRIEFRLWLAGLPTQDILLR